MQLYTPDNHLLLDIPVDDASMRLREIMGDNNLTLKFSLPGYVDIPIGANCEFKGESYILFTPDNFVKHHTEHYDYTLVLEAWQAYTRFVKFKFFTVERNPGEPDRMVGAPKLKFSLTATPQDFARLFVDCMNFSGVTGWEVGECIESDPVTIDFNHDYCFGVLQKFADAFGTEWEFENKTLHLRKVERRDSDGKRISFPLSYGYGNGILPGITRKQFDDSKVINRVWVQGGARNIDQGTYGNDTLLMPKNSRFEYDGKEYITDPTGSYVEEAGRVGSLSEDSLDVSKVYPRRVGTISRVIEVNDETGLYDIVDDSIPDTLDFSQMVIPGETMSVILQTGPLAGREFEVKYIHSERKFEIVPNTDNGLVYPQGNLIPEVGDKYGVFHMRLPQDYIDSAATEARDEAVKHLSENSRPKYTYQWNLDGIHAKKEWDAIGDYLSPGYFVEFSDPQFLPEAVDIRITSVKEYVNKPKSLTIELSNNVTGKSLSNVLAEIPAQEQAAERKDKDVMDYAKRVSRSIAELNYIKTALANNTEIDGGLVLTTLIKLGAILNDTWIERAGMSGAYGGDNDIAFYGGGSLQQAINLVANPEATEDVASFVVTMGGQVIMNKAIVRGMFESSKDGNRIVIEPGGSLRMIDRNNNDIAGLYFDEDIGLFRLKTSQYVVSLYPYALHLEALDESGLNTWVQYDNISISNGKGTQFKAMIDSDGILDLILLGLPQDVNMATEGAVWQDGENLKIKRIEVT